MISNSFLLEIAGGLGNQLFQYAAARSLALHNNVDLVVDPFRYGRLTGRNFLLNQFPVRSRIISYANGRKAWDSTYSKARRRITRLFRKRYVHTGPDYDQSIWHQPPGTVLSGWFQSYRYFEKFWPSLIDELDISHLMEREDSRSSIDSIYGRIAIHVRRGDYLSINGYGLPNQLQYYANAIDEARKEIGSSSSLMIFSDDIEWCKQQQIFAGANFYEPDIQAPQRDLFAMASCDSLIIANSTFSWWAAWIATQHNKLVYAPSRWTKGLDPTAIQLYPKKWKIICQ